jgi:hypothetical protein
LKFSPFAMPRPPETMIFAAVSSGRSDFATSRVTNEERPQSAGAPRVSTGALFPQGDGVKSRGPHGNNLDRIPST